MKSEIESHGKGKIIFKIDITHYAELQAQVFPVFNNEVVFVSHSGKYRTCLKPDPEIPVLSCQLSVESNQREDNTQYLRNCSFHMFQCALRFFKPAYTSLK